MLLFCWALECYCTVLADNIQLTITVTFAVTFTVTVTVTVTVTTELQNVGISGASIPYICTLWNRAFEV